MGMGRSAVIYGLGKSAAIVLEKTREQFGEEFCVEAMLSEKAGKAREFAGLPVIDFAGLAERGKAGDPCAVILPNAAKRMPELLGKLGALGHVQVYFVPAGEIRRGSNEKERFFVPVDPKKPWLMGFEFHVADHCNLNCKGCGHCANILERSFPSLEGFWRDLQRLRQLFAGVGLIRLMGGEPFLNQELGEYIAAARSCFPVSEIHIVTNGLLLPEVGEELLGAIAEHQVILDISQYPPTVEAWDRIGRVIEDYGMEVNISPVTEFYKRFTLGAGSEKETVFRECSTRTCHSLRDGKIAACIVPFSTEVLNRAYHLGVPVDGWIDLYEPGIDGEEINRRLDRPLELCAHCKREKEFFPWERCFRGEARLQDWVCQAEC